MVFLKSPFGAGTFSIITFKIFSILIPFLAEILIISSSFKSNGTCQFNSF